MDGEARSGAEGRVAAPEPCWMERRGSVQRDVWQHWGPHGWSGGGQYQRTHSSIGALLDSEVGSRASGHVAAPDVTEPPGGGVHRPGSA
jgi:hypothetical protein